MAAAVRPAVWLTCALLPLGLGATSIEVCTSFGCAARQPATFTQDHWEKIAGLFGHAQTAADERVAISRAIGLMEDIVGRQTGTDRDKAENWQRAGEPGELDCIAESSNTERYLQLLAERRLLRWHDVAPRQQRGLILTHWTAVITDRTDQRRWAVDSWFRDNALPAVVIPIEDWRAYREPDE